MPSFFSDTEIKLWPFLLLSPGFGVARSIFIVGSGAWVNLNTLTQVP